MARRDAADPFLAHVSAFVTASHTVLDVGAGTGRFALPLAEAAKHVGALDPSEAMLDLLRAGAKERALQNVGVVQAEWLDADVEPADVVICSHVLYPIADVVPFVQKLSTTARERVFVYIRVDPLPTDLGLWSEFYGEALQEQPVHADLHGVLEQIGVVPDVQIVRDGLPLTVADFDEALAWARNGLCLGETDAASDDKLRALLTARLASRSDGRLQLTHGRVRSAILSWSPE